MKNNKIKLIPFMIATLALAAGCGGGYDADPSPVPPITPIQSYAEPEDQYSNPGSLFTESGPSLLFEDSRARRVGDLILVRIVENTKAQHKADTTAEKTSGMELGVSALLGRKTVSPILAGGVMSGTVGVDPLVSASSASELSATGETTRENYVTTTIGGRVISVLPNGVLQVAGAREIRVNNETEYMVITGLVRTGDVLSDNSVLSTQLADSRISYYGKGVLADKQKPGWLTRLLDNIWPF